MHRSITQHQRSSLRTTLVGAVAAICLALPALVGAAAFAPAAQAGSGDFCVDYDLNPGVAASCEYDPHSHIYEVETWNTDGKGVGSCASAESGGSVCSAAYGSGYDEAYCKASCNGQSGRPYVTNHNPQYNSVFTGWDWWQ
jgi:hypothetical protein